MCVTASYMLKNKRGIIPFQAIFIRYKTELRYMFSRKGINVSDISY
ncbi:hypothetical protein DmGdi_16680 [Gluconobacter sp. Gdi]|nr:hypothetical protein DmGdi_16680 [Gluconobacter sp. Gdi]